MNQKANFKYIKNINTEKRFAEMFIYDEIGDEGINGRFFAYELKYLADYEDLDEIKVRINSVGGSVMHAFSIFSAILNTNKDKKVVVNTYNDGVAASSASFILLAGKKVFVKDYSRVMMHGVMSLDEDGNIKGDLSEKDKEALRNFSEMIVQVIVQNTGIDKSVIEDLLNNGRDNWFGAKEGADAGFYPSENIENTGLEIDLPEDLSTTELTVVMNKAQKIINSNNLKPLKMKKVIAALKLQEGSSEQVVLTAVENAINEANTSKKALETANNSIAEKDQEIQRLNGLVTASNKAAAASIVENAIKEGKFAPKDETEKTNLVNQCLKDVDGFKNMVALMPTKAANILDGVQNGGEGTKSLLEKVNNRGFRQLEKEDPTLLSEIRNSVKGEYVKLYNEQYKTQKTEADFQ